MRRLLAIVLWCLVPACSAVLVGGKWHRQVSLTPREIILRAPQCKPGTVTARTSLILMADGPCPDYATVDSIVAKLLAELEYPVDGLAGVNVITTWNRIYNTTYAEHDDGLPLAEGRVLLVSLVDLKRNLRHEAFHAVLYHEGNATGDPRHFDLRWCRVDDDYCPKR